MRLAADLFEAPSPRGAVLVAPATGVSRRIYRRLAAYLAGCGLSVVLIDYRGTGDSRPKSLRGFRASAEDWARLDLAAAVEACEALAPGRPVLWLGHSIGGQLLGLCPRRTSVKAALFVAAQSGYWRHWPPAYRWRLWLFWHVVVPGLSHTFGYLPLRRLTGGQDVPAAMALQWAEWGRDPRYLLKSPLSEEGRAQASLAIPLRSYAFTDDAFFGPVAAVDVLLGWHRSALVERRVVAPADLGRTRIGHFGWLKEGFEDTLWTEMADFLLSAVD